MPHRRVGEFLLFSFKQGLADCCWPSACSRLNTRQDALILAALGIQIAILAFHIVGTEMERFQTSVGS